MLGSGRALPCILHREADLETQLPVALYVRFTLVPQVWRQLGTAMTVDS